jgi:hypothetical protein
MIEVFAEFYNVMRAITVILIAVCVLQMVMLLSHYWHRVMPMRKRMKEQDRHSVIFVLAPPPFWTFSYHLLVTGIFTFSGIGITQSLLAVPARPPTVFTYAAPFLFGGMTMVISKFTEFYSEAINEAQWRLLRDEMNGGTSSPKMVDLPLPPDLRRRGEEGQPRG